MPLRGRERELHLTSQILFCDYYQLHPDLYNQYKSTRAICITGEAGIGKTAFANELLQEAHMPQYQGRFNKDEIITMTCYMADWDYVITSLARSILVELRPKSTLKELEDQVLARIGEGRYMVLLDNVDWVDAKALDSFIRRWVRANHSSMLMITRRTSPFKQGPPRNCRVDLLQGIADSAVADFLSSLNEDLLKMIEEEKLWGALAKLGNNPQKLIYLSWLPLRDKKGVEKCIDELSNNKAGVSLVEKVLEDSPFDMAHFLALGRVRDLEFDDDLLAFLWDRLGGGSTNTYVQTLKWLINKNLLLEDRGKLRLSAGVHLALEGPLKKQVGDHRIANIDYFISQYYRTLYASSSNVQSLERYVYHALRSGNFDSPYSYVFEGSVLDTAHYNGLSLELKTILRHFDNGLRNPEKGKESSELNGHRVEQAAKIAIELGRIYKDLSDHNECLNCMDKADKKLDEPSAASIDSATRRELKRRLWHYKAISLSQLGRTEDCLDYYSRVFKDGIVNEEFTWFDALSLGYYAYELKYHDIEEAEKLGEKALQLSRQIGDKNTIIKNLCNLGPTVFFMGKVIESEKFFADAYKESLAQPDASKDKREMGRILINSVVVYIAKKDWAEAEKRIEDCLKLNTEFGDRRRAGSARAYRAILHYKLGDQNRAREVMLDAIGQHLKVESWRELANEVTTYLWMLDPEFKGNLKRIPQARSLPTEVIKCIDHFNEDKALSVFIKFWIERFKPIVLS